MMASQQLNPIAQSKLAKQANLQALVTDISNLWVEAQRLRAKEGAKRLEHICNHFDRLTAETTYRWIDPVGFQHEVENSLSHRIALWHILRNCISVLPLILTWFSLYLALTAYEHDTFAGDGGKSFLQLWQNGFHGGTFLTFSTTAIVDVGFLTLFLLLIALTSYSDNRAYGRSTKFAQKLQVATEGLMSVVANNRSISVDKDAITNVADAVQLVVDDAMKANQKIIKETMEASQKVTDTAEKNIRQFMQNSQDTFDKIAQVSKDGVNQVVKASEKAVLDANDRTEKVFNRTTAVLNTFDTNVQNLQTVLTNYQARLDDLTTAIQQLANVSAALATNADAYTKTGRAINDNIAKLNSTQDNLLRQIGLISKGITDSAKDMNTAATNLGTATGAVEKVATQLDTGIKTTLDTMDTKVKATMDIMTRDVTKATNTMSDNVQRTVQTMSSGVKSTADEIRIQVDRAAISLKDVAPVLQVTADSLDRAADKLSNVSSLTVPGASSRRRRVGGIVGWLFSH
jgi:ABC-type transporter Mla subunit MlaD